MSDFWRPSIDPLQELHDQGLAIKQHSESISNLAQALNENAHALMRLSRHNQNLLNEIHKLRSEIERLKNGKPN